MDNNTTHSELSEARVATRTDIGLKRQRNEDFLGVERTKHGLLAIVCDGMGGHVGGERASRLAVDVFVETLRSGGGDVRELMRQGVIKANAAIYDEAAANPDLHGMGTTLVAALYENGRATVVNVGDSRGFLFHNGRLSRITEDHSLVEELVRQGKLTEREAAVHPQRNVITRALGTDRQVEPDFFDVQLSDGDSILLASDGLHGLLADNAIEAILVSYPNPEKACDVLVSSALELGGYDNVTVALLKVGSADLTVFTAPATVDPATANPVTAAPKREMSWLWPITLMLVAIVAVWYFWLRGDSLPEETPTPSPSVPSIADTLSPIDTTHLDTTVEQMTPGEEAAAPILPDSASLDSSRRGADSAPNSPSRDVRPTRPPSPSNTPGPGR